MKSRGGRRVSMYRRTRRVLEGGVAVVQGCFDGVWLGLLDPEHLRGIDEQYYDREAMYADPTYNQLGLWRWERRAIDHHFDGCRRIAVLGAGGGREVAALLGEGFAVDGFEPNPSLVARGNELLEASGMPPALAAMPRDTWPTGAGVYDGVIVGWGMYMLIADRNDRLALLRSIREHLQGDGPVLLSFFVRSGRPRYFRITDRIASRLRRARGRDGLGPGASLAPNFVRYFTLDEIAAELRETGFTVSLLSGHDYGHAVGRVANGHGSVPA